MTGTILNIITVLVGGVLGMLFGARLPERIRHTVVAGLGLFTAAIGVKMFAKSENEIVVLGAILVGGILGEWWRIEDGLRGLGGWLERRFGSQPATGSDISSKMLGFTGKYLTLLKEVDGFIFSG